MDVKNLVAREQRLADQGAICAYEQRIGLSRGSTRFAALTAGLGGIDLDTKGTVSATSASAAAIGISGVMVNGADNAATLRAAGADTVE